MTRRYRPAPWLIALMLVTACANAPELAPVRPPEPVSSRGMPAARAFGSATPRAPQRSNTELARDFVDLSLQLENGVPLPIFTRFEQPVTIGLKGRITPIFDHELDRLVGRLRREAKLDIRRVPDNAPAQITVEAITRQQLQNVVPTAACFVLPRGITWAAFSGNIRRRDLNWTDLSSREAATVFIPADIAPQEIRDCLHEEVAQALGPVNDLYRLDDSIFNDDNMHSVLTGFDMLMLRATYDPALKNGMSRAQVTAALPAIFARVNPRGTRYKTGRYQPSPRSWIDAIQEALSSGERSPARRRAADRALAIARQQGWDDTRLGLSYLTTGRLTDGRDAGEALTAFIQAAEIYDARPATAIHAANVGIQIAAFALASGDYEAAISICDRYIPAATRAENAALLADLEMVKSAALRALGQTSEARALRRDSFAWGRYGLRSDQAILTRAAEIDALVPDFEEGT